MVKASILGQTVWLLRLAGGPLSICNRISTMMTINAPCIHVVLVLGSVLCTLFYVSNRGSVFKKRSWRKVANRVALIHKCKDISKFSNHYWKNRSSEHEWHFKWCTWQLEPSSQRQSPGRNYKAIRYRLWVGFFCLFHEMVEKAREKACGHANYC